mmetsp:Transcript_101529/g.262431  ORF Transcript_101529/g.262431 Transcript_101529/m.262431 type:complete len:290 (+) Transcript_101529:276-1145(+)
MRLRHDVEDVALVGDDSVDSRVALTSLARRSGDEGVLAVSVVRQAADGVQNLVRAHEDRHVGAVVAVQQHRGVDPVLLRVRDACGEEARYVPGELHLQLAQLPGGDLPAVAGPGEGPYVREHRERVLRVLGREDRDEVLGRRERQLEERRRAVAAAVDLGHEVRPRAVGRIAQLLPRSEFDAAVRVWIAPPRFPDEEIHNASARFEVDDELSVRIRLVHCRHVEAPIEEPVRLVGSDLPVHRFPVHDLHARSDVVVVLMLAHLREVLRQGMRQQLAGDCGQHQDRACCP